MLTKHNMLTRPKHSKLYQSLLGLAEWGSVCAAGQGAGAAAEAAAPVQAPAAHAVLLRGVRRRRGLLWCGVAGTPPAHALSAGARAAGVRVPEAHRCVGRLLSAFACPLTAQQDARCLGAGSQRMTLPARARAGGACMLDAHQVCHQLSICLILAHFLLTEMCGAAWLACQRPTLFLLVPALGTYACLKVPGLLA